jgi:hypothetical protein
MTMLLMSSRAGRWIHSSKSQMSKQQKQLFSCFCFDSVQCLAKNLDSQFCDRCTLVLGDSKFIGHRLT